VYCSPFRYEEFPRFNVYTYKNEIDLWFDVELGIGGKLVDLVCSMYNVKELEALRIIYGYGQIPVFKQPSNEPPFEEPVILKI
jgi:hypothetical protein